MLVDEERDTLVEKEKSFQDAAFIGMGAERMKRKYEEKQEQLCKRKSSGKEFVFCYFLLTRLFYSRVYLLITARSYLLVLLFCRDCSCPCFI